MKNLGTIIYNNKIKHVVDHAKIWILQFQTNQDNEACLLVYQ